MGQLVKMDDFRYPWREVFTADGSASTLQVYVNDQTGEAEVVQMNDEGNAIRTALERTDALLLSAALAKRKV